MLPNSVGAHVSEMIGETSNGFPNILKPQLKWLKVSWKDYLSLGRTTDVRYHIHDVIDLAEGQVFAFEKLRNGVQIYNLGTGWVLQY